MLALSCIAEPRFPQAYGMEHDVSNPNDCDSIVDHPKPYEVFVIVVSARKLLGLLSTLGMYDRLQ